MQSRVGSAIVLAGVLAIAAFGGHSPAFVSPPPVVNEAKALPAVPEAVSLPAVVPQQPAPSDGDLGHEAARVVVTTLVATAVQAGVCVFTGICAIPGM
jgi:hypothetical protein